MKLKYNVSLGRNLQPQVVVAMIICNSIYAHNNTELVITSVADGKHIENSLHYVGGAFDCRILGIPRNYIKIIFGEISAALGQDFDVVLEKDHIHVEYDPRKENA